MQLNESVKICAQIYLSVQYKSYYFYVCGLERAVHYLHNI